MMLCKCVMKRLGNTQVQKRWPGPKGSKETCSPINRSWTDWRKGVATEDCGLPGAQKECLQRIKPVSVSLVPPEGDTLALERDTLPWARQSSSQFLKTCENVPLLCTHWAPFWLLVFKFSLIPERAYLVGTVTLFSICLGFLRLLGV